MDEVVTVALEEVALEGRQGCKVEHLWTVLEQKLPLRQITVLSPEIKQCLWAALIQRTEDLQLFTQADPPANQEASAAPAGKKTKKAKAAAPEPVRTMLQPSAVPTYQQAVEKDVRLLATDAVRMGVLGLYDALQCRFQLSDPQITTLEAIARRRTLGVLQSNLAAQMQITNSNFFYVVKCLEERGLIARTPVIVNTGNHQSTVLTTNVLHLQRFAPAVRLGPHQVFKMVDTPGGQQQLDMDSATYTIQDDARQLRRICERIAATQDKSVIESELKVVLGFSGPKGHRTWRRLKTKLMKAGQVENFAAEVNGKTMMCIRLLKEFKMPGEGEGEEDAEEAEDKTSAGRLQVEVSVERQVMEAILAAGEEGLLNTTLFQTLGLNQKRYSSLLVDLTKKYGLQVTVVTVSKAIHNRIQAPQHLIDQYRMGERMLGAPAPAPLQLPAPPGDAAGPSNAAGKGSGDAGPSQAAPSVPLPAATTTGFRITSPGKTGAGTAGATATGVAATASPAKAGAGTSTGAAAGAAGADVNAAGKGGKDKGKGKQRNMRQQKTYTDISDDRLKRLFARLDTQGYIVGYEIRSLLYTYEVENGILPQSVSVWQKGPDKKTINRLLARMEESGKVKHITVGIPGSYINGEMRTISVTVPIDFEATDDKIHEIQEYFCTLERKSRSASSTNFFAKRNALMKAAAAEGAGGAAAGAGPSRLGAAEGGGQAGGGGEVVEAGGLQLQRSQGRLGSLSQPVTRLLPEGVSIKAVRAELALQQAGSTAGNALSHKQLFGKSPITLRSVARVLKVPGVVETTPNRMAVLTGTAYQGELVLSKMLLSGFNWSKMVRARLLHYLMCRCVCLGGFTPNDQRLEPSAAQEISPLPYLGSTLHNTLQVIRPEPAGAADEVAPGTTIGPHTITARQLWASIPIGLALQLMGTCQDVPDLLTLVQSHVQLGDLSPTEQERILDKGANKRFAKAIDVLQKLQLVEVTTAPAATQPEPDMSIGTASLPQPFPPQHITLYHVATRGVIEEPPGPPTTNTDKQDGEGDAGDEEEGEQAEPPTKRRATRSGAKADTAAAATVPDAGAQPSDAPAAVAAQPVKRGRGRPRKHPQPPPTNPTTSPQADAAPAAAGTEPGAADAGEGKEGGEQGTGGEAGGAAPAAAVGQEQGGGEGAGATTVKRARGRSKRSPVELTGEPVRHEIDFNQPDGVDVYWDKLETVFGKATSSPAAVKCFPAAVAPEIMALPLWSNIRVRVSTSIWLQLVAGVQELMGGTSEIDKEQLAALAGQLGVERTLVNRVVQELLKRQLSARGVRGKLSKQVRTAALTLPPVVKARRKAGEAEQADKKRTREEQRVERTARREQRRMERLEAARVNRERELARLATHQQLVLSQLQANQQALQAAATKLEEVVAAQSTAVYIDVMRSQELAISQQQITREIQLKEQEQKRLKEQLEKLRLQQLQRQAAVAAPARAPATPATRRRVRKRGGARKQGGGVSDSEGTDLSSGGDLTDGTEDGGSEDEEMGGSESGGEGVGVEDVMRRVMPVRIQQSRQFFSAADDEALLRAWVTLRVDKGMEYSTASGRLPWSEMKGLPYTKNACQNRMSAFNKKYRTYMDAIVEAIHTAHAKVKAAREAAQTAEADALAIVPYGAPEADAAAIVPYAAPEADAAAAQEAGSDAAALAIVPSGAPAPAGDDANEMAIVPVQPAPDAGTSEMAIVPVQPAATDATTTTPAAEATGEAGAAAATEAGSPPAVPTSTIAALESFLVVTIEEVMRGPVAALLSAFPEKRRTAAEPVTAVPPIRIMSAYPGMKRPSLLATGALGKSLQVVGKQLRTAGGESATLTLSPGALCACHMICSLLVAQTYGNKTAGKTAASTISEGIQNLSRRFSESDLQTALVALRLGGWLAAGQGGTNALQLSAQFHNHLEGNVEIRKARAMLQGVQMLRLVLSSRLARPTAVLRGEVPSLPAPTPRPPVLQLPSMIVSAADAAAEEQGSHRQQGRQGQQGGGGGSGNNSSRAAALAALAAAVAGAQALNMQLLSVHEQLASLCPDLLTAPGASKPAQAASADVSRAIVQPTATHVEGPHVQMHVTNQEADVPSELLMLALPAVATNSMRLSVKSVEPPEIPLEESQDGVAAVQRQQMTVVPVTLALYPGDVSLLQSPQQHNLPRTPQAALGTTIPVASLNQTDQLDKTQQAALQIRDEPEFLLGLPVDVQGSVSELRPWLVGKDTALRQGLAWTTCEQHLRELTAHLVATEHMDAAAAQACQQVLEPTLKAIRDAGTSGVTVSALTTTLQSSGAVDAGSSTAAQVVATVLAVALRVGLIRVIAAFHDTRVAAVELSQHLVAAEENSHEGTVAHPGATTSAQAAEPSAGGACRQEVLLCPWHDSKGVVNQMYLQGLMHRALLAAECTPGAPEAQLAESLNVISPSFARLLLRGMAEQGLLITRCITVQQQDKRPSFLWPRAALAPPVQQSKVRHYFPVLQHGFANCITPINMPGLG